MSRTGTVLSDAAVMEHCLRYQPIPMKAAQSILKQDLQMSFGNKKLKYQRQMNRPHNFDTMAKSLSRISGNNDLRETLEKEYPKQVMTAMNAAPNGNGNGTESTASTDDGIRMGDSRVDDDLARRATRLLSEMPLPYPARQIQIPRLSEAETARRISRSRNIQIPRLSEAETARRISRSQSFGDVEGPSPVIERPAFSPGFSPFHSTAAFDRSMSAAMAAMREFDAAYLRQYDYSTLPTTLPTSSEDYLGDYFEPGPPMTPFVRGTGTVLGNNPNPASVHLDDTLIPRQSV